MYVHHLKGFLNRFFSHFKVRTCILPFTHCSIGWEREREREREREKKKDRESQIDGGLFEIFNVSIREL